MNSFPVRRISEPARTHAADCARLTALLANGDLAALVGALTPLLPLTSDGTPDLARERSAPVKDLLESIGRELTALHERRVAIEREFETWAAFSELPLQRLPRSYLRGGWAADLQTSAVLAELQRRRVRLGTQQLRTLTDELDRMFAKLGPVVSRIRYLDNAADQIIYRLYAVEDLSDS